MKTKVCPDCGGAGEWDVLVPDGRQLRLMREKCKTCNGTGRVPDNNNDDDNDNDNKTIIKL